MCKTRGNKRFNKHNKVLVSSLSTFLLSSYHHALPPSLLSPLVGEEGTFSDSSSSAPVAGVVGTEGFAGFGKGAYLWKGHPWNGNLYQKKPAMAEFVAGSSSILVMEDGESTALVD